MRARLAGHPLRPSDPGAADRDAQPAGGRRGGRGGARDRVLVDDVDLLEGGPVAELGGELAAALRVQIGDHDVGALLVQAPHRGRAEARGPAADQRSRSVEIHRRNPIEAAARGDPGAGRGPGGGKPTRQAGIC